MGNWVRILPANSKQTHNSNQRNSEPVSPGQFTIFRWIKTKLVYTPKFCITVVSNFSRTRYYSSLKRNTRQNICKILGDKQGALWSMWKLWMLQWIFVLRKPRRVFRLLTSDFRLKTSYSKLQTSDLTKFELRISDFWPLRLNAAWLDFWPPTSHFLLPTSHQPLLTSDFRFPTSDFQLPTSHFQLPTSNFRLPTWLLCQVRLPPRSATRVLRRIHKRDFAPGACSRGTLWEQSSSVCTNDFMGILHPREQNFHRAKCSTIFNRLNIWERAPGANWANLKTLPRVYWHVQNEPGSKPLVCIGLQWSRSRLSSHKREQLKLLL